MDPMLAIRPKGVVREIKWVDGMPVPCSRPIISKNAVEQMTRAALSLEYKMTEEDLISNPEFKGLTNGEVAAIRRARLAAAGCLEAFKQVEDRVLGKPKQQVESKSMKLTYQDYLEVKAKEEEEANNRGGAGGNS